MRAVMVERPGPADVLRVTEVPEPIPGDGELSIDVEYAGVGFVDTLFRRGEFALPTPFIPGLEVTGRVRALGAGVTGFTAGQPVAAVVYRKRGHIINVLTSSSGHESIQLPHTARVRGYSLRSWHQAGLDLVAVSDIDPVELANLEHGYTMPSPQTAEPAGYPSL